MGRPILEPAARIKSAIQCPSRHLSQHPRFPETMIIMVECTKIWLTLKPVSARCTGIIIKVWNMMTWLIAMCILADVPGNIGSGIRNNRGFGTCSRNGIQMGLERFLCLQPVPSVLLRPAARRPCPLPCIPST